MLTLDVLICTLAIAPSLISAELFLPGSGVEKLTKESFNQVMKETVSCVWLFFEAGVDTIISERAWLHSLCPGIV